jgi:hypothetical protein
MNSTQHIRKILFSAVVAISLSVLGSLPLTCQTAQSWGEPVNGLQMSLLRDQFASGSSKDLKFRVELYNQGETDLVLNLGIMLANGAKQYPWEISLTLTDLTDPQGKIHRLKLPGPAFIAGRMDPFVLPLPSSASFSISLDLRNCWSKGPGGLDLRDLKGGPYVLEAQFTGTDFPKENTNLDMRGISLMPYWKGTVVSNRLRFEVSRQ